MAVAVADDPNKDGSLRPRRKALRSSTRRASTEHRLRRGHLFWQVARFQGRGETARRTCSWRSTGPGSRRWRRPAGESWLLIPYRRQMVHEGSGRLRKYYLRIWMKSPLFVVRDPLQNAGSGPSRIDVPAPGSRRRSWAPSPCAAGSPAQLEDPLVCWADDFPDGRASVRHEELVGDAGGGGRVVDLLVMGDGPRARALAGRTRSCGTPAVHRVPDVGPPLRVPCRWHDGVRLFGPGRWNESPASQVTALPRTISR